MDANEVTAFYEGYQANRDDIFQNYYHTDWGSAKKAAWDNGWEKSRKDSLAEIKSVFSAP